MKKRISAFLDNDSAFGRLMSCLWIVIGSNLMFMIFSLPVITVGPALAALYHVQLKSMRGHADLNPITEFWKGFRSNFKQAMIFWIVFLLAAVVALLDIRFLAGVGDSVRYLRYAVCFVAGCAFAICCLILPVMAAFADSLSGLCRSAFYFAAKNPARTILIAAMNTIPLLISYLDVQRLPLYGFLWVTCGFGAIVRFESWLLLKDFNRFLPPVDE